MRIEILTQEFRKNLLEQGYFVDEILYEADSNSVGRKKSLKKTLRYWTGMPNDVICEGLFNYDRDVVSPKINSVILEKLDANIKTKTNENLPSVKVKEISRATGFSSEKIVNILSGYPFKFSVNGSSFVAEVQKPEFPSERLTFASCCKYGISPKRVSREARFQSRKPGGGVIQKAGLQNRNIDRVIRKKTFEEMEIIFTKSVPKQEEIEYGVMEELEIPVKKRKRNASEIIYESIKSSDVMRVFQWFKDVGLDKNWIYKTNEAAFAENLVRLAGGEPTDFLIWNCIGFKWFMDAKGNMPTCEINDNLDAAITPFFRQRISEMANILSSIGDPNITVLVPSNEAFNQRVWKYRQPEEERNVVINQAVDGLSNIFETVIFPCNVNFKVMRWDEYLQLMGADKKPQEYSDEGERRLRQSVNFEKIVKEAVKNGRGYFTSYGIKNIKDDVFKARQIMYYGVYAGEGVAYEELKSKGQNIVVVNFEEMRVPQMAFLGALGDLSIVTPIKTNEMMKYYQWETRQVAKRR